ncbi:MAG: glycosyltransferase family 4 protein [Candidatus Korarchaeum sp.]|nr:glycosyltransferase family 4 protein [Candidatus Korarchaeum sp.]MDW8035400.1 glycosyltransferase family 4 protein [Candidatus Korarchaeum sp.]
MRLALVGPYHPAVGGIQVYMTYLAKELASIGEEVTVVSYKGSRSKWGERVLEIPNLSLKGLRGFSFVLGSSMTLSRERPDLAICHYAATSGLAGFISSMLGVRYIIVFHGSDLKLPKLSKVAASRASAIVAVSSWVEEELRRIGLRADSIIPGGIDSDLFSSLPPKEELKRELGVEGSVVLSVGSLTYSKGFDMVPRVAKLVNERVNATFLIIGSGPEEGVLRELSSKLGVSDKVLLLGRKCYEETAKYYGAADLLLHPARYEGYGLTALESLAAGTPVVASDTGGLRDTVIDGVDGFLLPRDEVAMAERVVQLLMDDSLRRDMGRRGREKALRRSWRIVAEEYEELIARVVS